MRLVFGLGVSYQLAGPGYGRPTRRGASYLTIAIALLATALWAYTFGLLPVTGLRITVVAVAIVAYLGLQRVLTRALNWAELKGQPREIPKGEIDGFTGVSNLLMTAGGLSLLTDQPAPVYFFILLNVGLGLLFLNASRRLRRGEIARDSVSYQIVNDDVYDILRHLVTRQTYCVIAALLFAAAWRLG